MPERIANLISNEDDQNTLPGVIPRLGHLLSRDPGVEVAYLCTEHAVQIHKLPGEGAHFCGYRNMQMLCLALGLSGQTTTREIDLRRKLSIPQLQDLVEGAWDRGINAHGWQQTGGIKGTRKHVGTSEVCIPYYVTRRETTDIVQAEALLLSLEIPCTGSVFGGEDASTKLLDFIEKYFSVSIPEDSEEQRIRLTSRPPVFLQRPRHSVAVVGVIRLRSGKRRVVVFDPAWRPPTAVLECGNETRTLIWKELLALRRYSKSERYLKRFKALETLTIDELKVVSHMIEANLI
jgi:hypothetical protein